MDDLGVVHAPAPVEPGDIAAFEHGPLYELVAVLVSADGALVPTLARPVGWRLREGEASLFRG